MNWQLTSLLAQANIEDLRERVEATTLPGTTVPDSALHRNGGINFFGEKFWFPTEQASEYAGKVDYLYMGVFYISLFFFVGVIATMIYFVVKYRRKGNEINPLPSPSHNTGIEILWSVLPSILLVWIFYEGAIGFFNMRTARDDSEEIQVVASRYNWVFTYPDGDSSAELHLVLDRPTRLVMQSNDVLHSLFVPAFRQKMDVVPGRYTYAYIMPTVPGQYRLACAEYCGEGHSRMRTMAEVHKSAADRKANTQWIKAEHLPWQNGERTYKIMCSGCHKVDGTAATGPALNLLWGKGEETLAGGSKVKIDREYIQESIWEPDAKVVEGFGPPSKMNSFKGQLQIEDINDIVAYLKYLHDPNLVATDADAETANPDAAGDGNDEAAVKTTTTESTTADSEAEKAATPLDEAAADKDSTNEAIPSQNDETTSGATDKEPELTLEGTENE